MIQVAMGFGVREGIPNYDMDTFAKTLALKSSTGRVHARVVEAEQESGMDTRIEVEAFVGTDSFTQAMKALDELLFETFTALLHNHQPVAYRHSCPPDQNLEPFVTGISRTMSPLVTQDAEQLRAVFGQAYDDIRQTMLEDTQTQGGEQE